jgi:hypothetical protein
VHPGLVSDLRSPGVHYGIEEMLLDPFPLLQAKIVLGTDAPCGLKHRVSDDSFSDG